MLPSAEWRHFWSLTELTGPLSTLGKTILTCTAMLYISLKLQFSSANCWFFSMSNLWSGSSTISWVPYERYSFLSSFSTRLFNFCSRRMTHTSTCDDRFICHNIVRCFPCRFILNRLQGVRYAWSIFRQCELQDCILGTASTFDWIVLVCFTITQRSPGVSFDARDCVKVQLHFFSCVK